MRWKIAAAGFCAVLCASVGAKALLLLSAASTSAVAPLAEWKLDSPSISGTTVADASGHGNTATVVNGPLTFPGIGATFNGSTQYLDASSALNAPLSGSNAFSVTTWFNVISYPGNPRIVGNSHVDADNSGFELFVNSNGTGEFEVGNGTTKATAVGQATSTGTWYFLAGTYNGSTATLYLNGAQAATASVTGPMAAGKNPDVNVGRGAVYNGDYFHGPIYDVRIYNKVLSSTQISALYQSYTPQAYLTPTYDGTHVIQLSNGGTGIACNIAAGSTLATVHVFGNYSPTGLSLVGDNTDYALSSTTGLPANLIVGSNGMVSNGMTCTTINGSCSSTDLGVCQTETTTIKMTP